MELSNGSVRGAGIGAGIVGIVMSAVIGITQFTHDSEMPKTNTLYIVVAGHGSFTENMYQTPGKQSPTWEDGLKIYEGYSNRLMALELTLRLTKAGMDVIFLNNELQDMTLQERVTKINAMYEEDKRAVVISLHHNAQPTSTADYVDFEGLGGYTSTSTGGASGIEIFTSPGYTESDIIVNDYIFPELEKTQTLPFRYGSITKGKEAMFTILSQTKCPALLIEWGFMTTYTDCLIIADEKERQTYINSLTIALLKFNSNRYENTIN